MKVLMTGGTGFLGSSLRRRLEVDGHTITCLSRSRRGSKGATTFLPEDSLPGIDPHEVVINLAGESVVGLWTRSKRRAIYHSRVDTTRALVEWMEKSADRPRVFLSGSAVGIYGNAGETELTEGSDVSGAEGFLAQVCRDWEQAAAAASTRTVLMRIGHVFDPGGGYLKQVLPIMRRFPIVILGPRDSYVPWIALEDWVELTMLALSEESVVGPLNLVGPNPVTQEELAKALAAKLGKRVWGRVPRWAIKLGAGEFGESITASQRVVPRKALEARYEFQFPTLESYLARARLGAPSS